MVLAAWWIGGGLEGHGVEIACYRLLKEEKRTKKKLQRLGKRSRVYGLGGWPWRRAERAAVKLLLLVDLMLATLNKSCC